MEVTDIVAILVFVLPGILAEKISNRMDYPSCEAKSEFSNIINGVLLSLPIIGVTGLIFCLIKHFGSLNQLISEFDNLSFLLLFTASAFLIALTLGVVKGLSKDFWIGKMNCIRKKYHKLSIDDKSCWRKLFLDDSYNNNPEDRNKYPKYIIIELNGKKYEGFALCYSLPNEEMAVALENPEYMYKCPDFKAYLTSEIIYTNIEKGIIIKSYDTKKLNEHLKEQSKDNSAISS